MKIGVASDQGEWGDRMLLDNWLTSLLAKLTLTLSRIELTNHIKQVLSPQTIQQSEKRIEFEENIEKTAQLKSEE